MAIRVWCKHCWTEYQAVGVFPAVCPSCDAETVWTTHGPVPPPNSPFRVTKFDRRFLHSVGIETDEDPSL